MALLVYPKSKLDIYDVSTAKHLVSHSDFQGVLKCPLLMNSRLLIYGTSRLPHSKTGHL